MATNSFDYSKWDKIELSDDESDLHPNIDKDSWFRMKHRARLEREAKEDEEIRKLEKQNTEDSGRLKVIMARLEGLKSGSIDDDAEFEDTDALHAEAADLEQQIAKRKKRVTDITEKRAWNIDNICKVTDEKTIVNSSKATSLKAEDFVPSGETEARLAKSATTSGEAVSSSTVESISNRNTESSIAAAVSNSLPNPPELSQPTNTTNSPRPPSQDQRDKLGEALGPVEPFPQQKKEREKFAVISYNDYALAHEDILERYSEIKDMEETKEFLFKHCDILLHEHAQSYMLLSCLEDEMNWKHDRMQLVCRQSQILSHITELATSLKRDPRDVILPFFRRIGEQQYYAGFVQAVQEFTARIKKRAVEKRKEMDAESARQKKSAGKEDTEYSLGPGGLDPFEVLESLPETLREAFESQELGRLQEVLAAMDPAEAKRYMKMCVDSGLWVPADSSVFD